MVQKQASDLRAGDTFKFSLPRLTTDIHTIKSIIVFPNGMVSIFTVEGNDIGFEGGHQLEVVTGQHRLSGVSNE